MDKTELDSGENQETIYPIGASLKQTCVAITSQEAIEELSSKGYGIKKDNLLCLSFYEALFLLGKGAIYILDEAKKIISGTARSMGIEIKG